MLGHLDVVVIQLLLAGQSEAGGDDGQDVRAHLLGALAHVDGVAGGDAAGAGIHGDTALHLVDGGLQDLLLLLQAQDVTLAVGAEGEDAVDAAGDLPLDLVAQLGDVHALILRVHGSDDGRDNALDCNVFHIDALLTNTFYRTS